MHAMEIPRGIQGKTEGILQNSLLVFLGTWLIALSSHLSITIPFTAIPFTVQPQTVLFLSACLGPQRAVMCVALYLTEGLMGFPVFSHGRSGLWHLLSPCGGYLLSYLPISYLTGYMFQRYQDRTPLETFVYFSLGNAGILIGGTLWLAFYVGPMQAIIIGFIPFIATDLVKNVALTRLWAK